MTFYGQLDGLPKPSEFDLADAGLIAVFVCFGCFQVAAVLHTAQLPIGSAEHIITGNL
ncbi:MAG: hypothetical protein ABL966_03670 [Acidimicrobiales bacterium]